VYFIVVGILLLFRIGLFTYFVLTDGQYHVPDSTVYIDLAHNLLEHQAFSLSSQPPFEVNFFRTPGYPLFLAAASYLGVGDPYWIVFWQELIYCITLWFFYRYGLPIFGKTITRATLLFLLIEPGGLAFPIIFYSETLFLPFFVLGVLLIGYYLKTFNWRFIVMSGVIMGLGILIRPALQYFPVIVAFTLIAFNYRQRRCWIHSGLLLLTVSFTVSPWLIHNHQLSGKMFLSGQQNNMFAKYHVPRIWSITKNIPFSEGQSIMKNKIESSIKQKEKLQQRSLTMVEIFDIQKSMALNELKHYPYVYAKQWFIGCLRAMVGLHLPTLNTALKIPKYAPSLHDIKGYGFLSKLNKFLQQQPLHIIFLLIFRGLIALFALLGALAIIKSKNCFLWILVLVNFYFICMAGPMADSRFRFPVESFWFIQACYGFIWGFSSFKKTPSKEIIYY